MLVTQLLLCSLQGPWKWKWKWSRSIMSVSLRPCGLLPTTPLCPWNSPGKNARVGSHSILQEIFPNKGWNPGLLDCRQILYHLSHQGSPYLSYIWSLYNWCDIIILLQLTHGINLCILNSCYQFTSHSIAIVPGEL